jgi:hypothetical protein
MSPMRRKFIRASTAVAAFSMSGPWHSRTFTARQYHSQPEDIFIHFYNALGANSKIVDFNRQCQAVAAHEVDGREHPLANAEETSFTSIIESTYDHL